MAKSKLKNQIHRAKKAGLSNIEFARIQENARKTAEIATQKMEKRAIEKAFLFMLAIPLNVLVADYWEKSAKKKLPKFINECQKLYDAVENGTVKPEELADLLEEYSGVNITAVWMEGKRHEDDE